MSTMVAGRGGRGANPRRRIRLGLLFVVLALLVFSVRLFQIQGLEASAYAAVADEHRTQRDVLPAVRGTITDAHGVALATTVEVRDVTVDQTLVKDPKAQAAALAPLVDKPIGAVRESLTGTKRFGYVAKGLDLPTWQKIEALGLPGIYSQRSMGRVYPAGQLGANVVGFVGADGRGLGGVEFGLDDQLAGKDGSATFEVGAGGQQIPTAADHVLPAVDGSDVTLTIDRDIQYAAQQAIAEQVKKTGSETGTVIVSDPSSGAILAMATAPTFDPNAPAKASPANRGNRALTEIYEPGSTAKVITTAAALEEGAVTPDTHFSIPSSLSRGGRTFKDDVEHGLWQLTTTGMLARSSNMGAMMTAEKIGRVKLYEYLQRFGLGSASGLGMQGESPGLLTPVGLWNDTNFATISFGQGLSVNSLQATNVFSTVANDGVRVEPTIVKSYTRPDGTVEAAAKPRTHRVISAKTATKLRAMMEEVVSAEGTAELAKIPGYRIAGKTGTANRVDATCGCYKGYTASFIGMAPADDPKLVVSVVLQRPRSSIFGGVVAAPVFRDVMSFALGTLRIPPTGAKAKPMQLTFGDG